MLRYQVKYQTPAPLGDGRGEVPGGDLGAIISGQAGSAWAGLGWQPHLSVQQCVFVFVDEPVVVNQTFFNCAR